MSRLLCFLYCFALINLGQGKCIFAQNSSVIFSNSPTALEVVDNSFNVLSPTYTDGLFTVTSSVNTGFEMYMDSLQSTTGSQISMPVYVNGFTDITSMQGSITFDASVISYLNTSNFNLPGLSSFNFGTTQTGQGILTYSWYDASLQGLSVTDSTLLFSIDFTVTGTSGQNSSVSFSNTPTSLEVVDNSFNVLSPTYTNGLFEVTSSVNTSFEMYMDSIQSTTGSQISMPVYVNSFTDITSMQGSITFDASVISYLNISNFNLPGLSISSFGTTQTGQGVLTYSWYDASLQGVTVADSTQLFAIDFTVIGSSGQNSGVSFSNTPTSLEVVDIISTFPILTLTDGYITIDYISEIQENKFIISLYPNLVKVNQNVNINDFPIGKTIVVFDVNGKITNNYNFKLNTIQFLKKGMFYLLIEGGIFKCLVI
jgi:hypothetical protein